MPPKGPNVSRTGHLNDTQGRSHNVSLPSKNKFRNKPIQFFTIAQLTPVTPVETVPSVTGEQVSLAITSLIEGLSNLSTNQFDVQQVLSSLETIQSSESSSQYNALSSMIIEGELFNFSDFGQIFTNESLTFLLPEMYWNPPDNSNPPN
jgi:hypothetical protein